MCVSINGSVEQEVSRSPSTARIPSSRLVQFMWVLRFSELVYGVNDVRDFPISDLVNNPDGTDI